VENVSNEFGRVKYGFKNGFKTGEWRVCVCGSKKPSIILIPGDKYGGECIVTGVERMNLAIKEYKVLKYYEEVKEDRISCLNTIHQ